MKNRLIGLIRKYIKRAVPSRFRPGPYLHNKVHRITEDVVYTGPFRGMKYLGRSYCSALLPKILGTYELELHPIVEAACGIEVDRIIDIGAAEGYYAVGFAMRRPGTPVVAFESGPDAQELMSGLARLNGVSKSITILGKCEPSDLAEQTREGVSLVVCDCEGYEAELLNMDRVPGLARCYILVETHDFIIPELTKTIDHRFAASHDITRITQRDRRREDFPITDWYIRRMQELDLLGAMSEGRPVVMDWLWMTPRSNSHTPIMPGS